VTHGGGPTTAGTPAPTPPAILATIDAGAFELRSLVVARVYGTVNVDKLRALSLAPFPPCIVDALGELRRRDVAIEALPAVDREGSFVALRIGARCVEVSLAYPADDIKRAVLTFAKEAST
jgi:hypothetical protein